MRCTQRNDVDVRGRRKIVDREHLDDVVPDDLAEDPGFLVRAQSRRWRGRPFGSPSMRNGRPPGYRRQVPKREAIQPERHRNRAQRRVHVDVEIDFGRAHERGRQVGEQALEAQQLIDSVLRFKAPYVAKQLGHTVLSLHTSYARWLDEADNGNEAARLTTLFSGQKPGLDGAL